MFLKAFIHRDSATSLGYIFSSVIRTLDKSKVNVLTFIEHTQAMFLLAGLFVV